MSHCGPDRSCGQCTASSVGKKIEDVGLSFSCLYFFNNPRPMDRHFWKNTNMFKTCWPKSKLRTSPWHNPRLRYFCAKLPAPLFSFVDMGCVCFFPKLLALRF